MLTIGSEVIVKTTKQTGVIKEWNTKNPGFLLISVFNTDLFRYEIISVHPVNLEEITNPLYHQMGNEDDKEGQEIIMEAMIDLALATGDKAWFEKLMVQKKRVRKSRKETEADRARIKVGSVVCDQRGMYLGIVTQYCSYYSDQVLIRVWSPEYSEYLTFRKAVHLLQPVENQKLLSWVNAEVNYKSKGLREDLTGVVRQLALDTNDKEWFNTANEKETSDGA